jgi:hypothetical protein
VNIEEKKNEQNNIILIKTINLVHPIT